MHNLGLYVAWLTLASACGGQAAGFGDYVLRGKGKAAGMIAIYSMPAPLNDALIAEVERIRAGFSAPPPPFYILAVVDNRRGRNPVRADGIRLERPDGSQAVVQTVGVFIKNWAAHAKGRDLERWFALAEEEKFGGLIAPGRVAAQVLAPVDSHFRVLGVVLDQTGQRLKRKD